jgi:ABC-2 type transport system ATP-binding protein
VDLGVDSTRVAYCPDAAEFEPWLSALETVDVAASLIGRPQPRDVIVETLDRVGLGHAASRRVGGFSRGMRARLGLAAGLIGDPAVLIADEPAAALDPAGKVEIIDLLAGLSGSTTVLVSSHDLADVERICDDIGVLVDGRLAYQGSLDELLSRAAPALRIVVRPPAEALMAALLERPWIHGVTEEEPGVLSVGLSDATAAEADLPGVLAACNTRLVEVRRAGVSLQDIFFEITATGPRERAETRADS